MGPSNGAGFTSVHVPTAPGQSGRMCAAFRDGTACTYDAMKRTRVWCLPPGHTDTVFGAEFDPRSPDTLATASFDGTVKLWHMPTMELKVGPMCKIRMSNVAILEAVDVGEVKI